MGDEAENLETETPEVDETETPEVEGGEESTEEIVEVYLEGDDETPEGKQKTTEQDRINAVVQKRVAREKRTQVKANDEAVKQVQANAILQEQNKLLTLRNEQLQQGKQLSPDDFDDGVTDPKYIAALVQQQVAAQQPAPLPAVVVPKDNTDAIRTHVTAAMTSGLKDFEEQEDKVIEEIGVEAHNYIVVNFPGRSHLMTFALAKNLGKLVELGNHVRSNDNQKALLLLGEISATAKVRKVSQSNTPDPVDQVEGSVNSSNPWEIKLDKLRDKVVEGKATMGDILALKKQAAAKGVNL